MTQAVDRVNFILTLSVMLAMAIPLLLFPEASALALETAYNFLATELGWLYILTAIVAFGAVLFEQSVTRYAYMGVTVSR